MKKCLICGHNLKTGSKYCSIKCKANSQKGNHPWNFGLTQLSDNRVKSNIDKSTKTIQNQFKNGRTSHCYGKTKENYKPLQIISQKNSVHTKLQIEKIGIDNWMKDRKNFNRKGLKNSEYQKDIVRRNIIQLRHDGKIKHKDTGIEIKMENIFKTLKLKYISQPTLYKIGTPDFYLVDYDVYIYVDGCYWHGCKQHYPKRIKAWNSYVNVNKKLTNGGYTFMRFWEHDIEKNIEYIKQVFMKLMI